MEGWYHNPPAFALIQASMLPEYKGSPPRTYMQVHASMYVASESLLVLPCTFSSWQSGRKLSNITAVPENICGEKKALQCKDLDPTFDKHCIECADAAYIAKLKADHSMFNNIIATFAHCWIYG